jgi:ankyrin repeat protein
MTRSFRLVWAVTALLGAWGGACGCGGSPWGARDGARAEPTPEVSFRSLTGALIDQRADKAARILAADPTLVTARDEEGDTALHIAAALNDTEVVTLLLGKGADIQARNNDGDTPLHRAADNGHVEVAQLLLERGARLDAANTVGETPLHQVSEAGMAELLCSRGAPLDARTSSATTVQIPDSDNPGFHKPVQLPAGSSPLAAAMTLGRTEVAEVIERHGGR